MKKKLYASLILFSIASISVLIMLAPTFFTKGVSRVSLNQELQLPLILNDTKDIKLIFFGYAGCVNVCTPRLQDLALFYETLGENTKKRVGVEFLDISVPQDIKLPNQFAQYFHKDFKGVYLDELIMREYTKAFRVYFSQSLLDKTEFDHSSNLYLVTKDKDKKSLRYIYTSYPFDFKQIKLDIEELLHE